jgi:hypothetical protein
MGRRDGRMIGQPAARRMDMTLKTALKLHRVTLGIGPKRPFGANPQ